MRLAQTRYHDGTGHWNTYKCRSVADVFHYGHLPQDIVHGEVTRGEVYGDG